MCAWGKESIIKSLAFLGTIYSHVDKLLCIKNCCCEVNRQQLISCMQTTSLFPG